MPDNENQQSQANPEDHSVLDLFDLTGLVAVITGGAGMLGARYADAIAEAGGSPILVDLDGERAGQIAGEISNRHQVKTLGVGVDITSKIEIDGLKDRVIAEFGRVDILINNAALTVKGGGSTGDNYFAPFEEYSQELFEKALSVNLTGSFLITQSIGSWMAANGSGIIVNISSDVAMISPDHRIYEGMEYEGQPFNTPIAYSMSKAALLAMTRYLATYWADSGVRVNALVPAGVFDDHDDDFVTRLSNVIPMSRMAHKDEYKGAILFLCSKASSFMTGASLVIDGGRTAW
jgi:NAD(P)-dependent dehydrogenase (short-subunit alcohol dehydrogenase family)